jgi:hypothetical protein
MDRFAMLSNRLKEIVLATKLANQAPADKDKPVIPQEPES